MGPLPWPDLPSDPIGVSAHAADALFEVVESALRGGLASPVGNAGNAGRADRSCLADDSCLADAAAVPVPVTDLAGHPAAAELERPQGVFVTLEVGGGLNGCVGTLEAAEPLAVAVATYAYRAAFADPRLPRLTASDWPDLGVKISLLGQLIALTAVGYRHLAAQLRPGRDGLLLAAGSRRATFLPAVWEKVPDPIDFVLRLEDKAGLRSGSWPTGIEAWRYESVELRGAVTGDRLTREAGHVPSAEILPNASPRSVS